jgi:hypothetical protein
VIQIIIGLFICQFAWGKVSLEFKPNQISVNQGEIVEGHLILNEGTIPTMSLKGKNIGKTLYIFNIEPFVGNGGAFQAKTKLIFSKVPEANSALENVNGEEIFIFWNNLNVNPTEESQSFLLGDFEIPGRKKIIPWIIALLVTSLIGYIVWRFKKRVHLSRNLKKRKLALRDKLAQASSYDEVVIIWKNKHQTLKEFPNMEEPFKNLEVTLFKYQFKPQRTNQELEQVMEAYQKFKEEVLKGNYGI